MNSTLESLANGSTTVDECSTVIMQFARQFVRGFLKVNPTHGYLKDDLISAASLTIVITCQRIQQKGDIRLANTNYLSTCVWNGLIEAVRLEQTIKPPKSFNSVSMNVEDMPKRVLHGDVPIETWTREQDAKTMVSDLDLTEIERKVLDYRVSGCKFTEIASELGIKVYQLKKHVKSIQRKWKTNEECN